MVRDNRETNAHIVATRVANGLVAPNLRLIPASTDLSTVEAVPQSENNLAGADTKDETMPAPENEASTEEHVGHEQPDGDGWQGNMKVLEDRAEEAMQEVRRRQLEFVEGVNTSDYSHEQLRINVHEAI